MVTSWGGIVMTSSRQAVLVAGVGAHLAALVDGTLPGWSRVAETAHLMTVAPGGTIYREGEAHPHLYFVVSGLLRSTADRAGDERVLGFTRPGQIDSPTPILPPSWAQTAMTAYGNARPSVRASFLTSTNGAVASAPSTIIRFDVAPVVDLVATEPVWARLVLTITAQHLASRGARLRDLLVLTPQERYEKVLLEEPEVVKAVSQRELAYMLGITPESLSRISARLRQRQRVRAEEARTADAALA